MRVTFFAIALASCLVLGAAGCGRVRFGVNRSPTDASVSADANRNDGGPTVRDGAAPMDSATADSGDGGDATTDDAGDADPGPRCPMETLRVGAGATAFCIDQAEQGAGTWDEASARCLAVGKRLCADGEWWAACVDSAVGPMLVAMTDGWEWVGSAGWTRGNGDCVVEMTGHPPASVFAYRCCADAR